jgi:N-methylhydantoinase A
MTAEILGIDVGGTFTDFVLVADGALRIHKRLTTPDDPAQAVLAGSAELGLAEDGVVIHGSTIATNALLERRGARTALVTTAGFRDVLAIGRQNRPDLYALQPRLPSSLVPDPWRFELHERVDATGAVLTPLDSAEIDALVPQLQAEGIESVAVCFLFSFLHPEHEQLVRERLQTSEVSGTSEVYISLSSDILPEYREYERTSTTVINAYVAPKVGRYLARLEGELSGRRLRIMQSNGGAISAAQARAQAARTALSGPAGGVVGAFHVARLAGLERVITFDMGGTSTDVALCPGGIPTTSEGEIAGFPLRLPIIDIHAVGAGGGSIARVDAGGALIVGPESAGADPGPACYGRGGTLPTVSDANLVLGRLHTEHFLGGALRLDEGAARAALEGLAQSAGMATPEQAARGVIRIANATMERAIRRISIERGHDPRDFTLLAFGGAGPLHACDLAAALGIPRVLVPHHPGVLSALGMVVADLVKDYVLTVMQPAAALTPDALMAAFAPLEERARADLAAEGIAAPLLEHALDMRYVGQSYEISVPVAVGHASSVTTALTAFHTLHGQRFGHQHPDEPVEVVNLRLKATGATAKPTFAEATPGAPDAHEAQIGARPAFFEAGEPVMAAHFERERLQAGHAFAGPAIVFQLDATTVVPPGWSARVDEWGNMRLTYA